MALAKENLQLLVALQEKEEDAFSRGALGFCMDGLTSHERQREAPR